MIIVTDNVVSYIIGYFFFYFIYNFKVFINKNDSINIALLFLKDMIDYVLSVYLDNDISWFFYFYMYNEI